MALPDVENGRGTFSTVGKDNGERYYIYALNRFFQRPI